MNISNKKLQKLYNYLDKFEDGNRRYIKTPCIYKETYRVFKELYKNGVATTFYTDVKNICEKCKMSISEDEHKINYTIRP